VRTIAGIGSRETPTNIQSVMIKLGYALAEQGRILHSGGAEHADKPFQEGVESFCRKQNINACERQKIFIPKDNFKGLKADEQRGIVNFENTDNYNNAVRMAAEFYLTKSSTEETLKSWPHWMKGYMGRNCYQILSEDLVSPVSAVICWTKDGSLDGSKRSSGGTGQALRLAKYHKIPVFNLQRESHLKFVTEHILDKGLKKINTYSY
jgi:hypothetical protein